MGIKFRLFAVIIVSIILSAILASCASKPTEEELSKARVARRIDRQREEEQAKAEKVKADAEKAIQDKKDHLANEERLNQEAIENGIRINKERAEKEEWEKRSKNLPSDPYYENKEYLNICNLKGDLDVAKSRVDFQKQMQREYGVFRAEEILTWNNITKNRATNIKEVIGQYEKEYRKKFTPKNCPPYSQTTDALIVAGVGEINEENVLSKLCSYHRQEKIDLQNIAAQRTSAKEVGVYNKVNLYEAGSGLLIDRQALTVLKDIYSKQLKKTFNPNNCR
jgi:hypothetical protein